MAATRPVPTVIDHDPQALAEVMAELVAAGKGWVNLLPEIPENVPVPSTPSALAVFSKRGPVVPLGTWTAPSTARNGTVAPSELGVQHGTARRGQVALDATAAEIPAGWTVLSDNPRRGLVVRPPSGTTVEAQAAWLLAALSTLCIPPQTGRFQLFRYAG